MWPWGHLAVGYLAYAMLRRRSHAYPTEIGTLALAFGTQVPDLVDKPLAWTLGVLPSGRSLAHSLVVAILLWVVVLAIARRMRRWEVGSAFVAGHASHIVSDAFQPSSATSPTWRFSPGRSSHRSPTTARKGSRATSSGSR